ncbi:hypothetical protein VP01_2935g1 [Puccinia sorghi]|uniref:Uncharacterized protein n=1 Tax=Puccinia sorghi TaxID=27349 RepID=A0A0L6V1W7_9BASI|nr:hypothetical protein VP01_2935g1 [Puccinia sorghi]
MGRTDEAGRGILSLTLCIIVIDYLTAWSGCSHHTRLWDNSDLNQNKEKYFFPRPNLAALCFFNEHCIGTLKGRFQLLKGLFLGLLSEETMDQITK